MDLIAAQYGDEGDDEETKNENEMDLPRSKPTASSSSEYYSSEYYSSSSSSSSANDDDGNDDDDSSDDEVTASRIDSLIKSKGWEALNDCSDEEAVAAPRTRNEVLPEVPEALPADFIRGEDVLHLAGNVSCVVENTVVVQHGGPGCPVYDIGSLLCVERAPLGYVDEVFGPVKEPLYSLRAPDATIESIAVGNRVFAVERLSSVVVETALYRKGYDNSGKFDEEAEGDLEFSDDEKEAEARRKRKGKRKGRGNGGGRSHQNNAHNGAQQHHQHHQRYPTIQQHHQAGPAPL